MARNSLAANQLFDKELTKIVKMLGALGGKELVIRAKSRGINVAKRALVSNAVPRAARTARVNPYHIRRKMPEKFQHNANKKIPRAKITIRRTDMAAISLFARGANSRVNAKVTYKRGDLDISAITAAIARGQKGQGVKVGKGKAARTYPGAFISKGQRRQNDPKYDQYVQDKLGAKSKKLKNKHWQVLKRQGPKPFPLDVIKIPLRATLTGSFRAAARTVWRPGGQAGKAMKQSFVYAMKKQLGVA